MPLKISDLLKSKRHEILAIASSHGASNIDNTLIQVASVERSYSQATDEFGRFYKLVGESETDSRLDQGIEVLKDILVAVNDMNTNLGGKMDSMLTKQDSMLDKQDAMLDKQDDLLEEVRDARKELKSYMDQRFEHIEVDVAEIKAALKAKGII